MTQANTPVAPIKRKPLWTNWITLIGLLHVLIGVLLLLTFWLFMLVSPEASKNQYMGIIGCVMLPGIFVTGLVLCPVGIVLRKRRVARNSPIWEISTKAALLFLAVTFFMVLPVLGVAGYTGFQFTETSEFCGTICHNMDPQYQRYGQSPHARVTCSGCHIGAGAGAFVKAKLAGVRQLGLTITGTYDRPVPPAITALRPARDTCEDCHWPSQFFGSLLRKTVHFAPDENNTRHDYDVLMKVGGLNNTLGVAEGIHMHMLNRIEYVADDPLLNHIPWIRYSYPDGRTVVFRSDGKPASDPPPVGKSRILDCIDCHNSAGHQFLSPERAVDHALAVGKLDATLPYIKREGVRVLSGDYKTKAEGLAAVEKGLTDFYSASYPDRKDDARKAAKTVVDIYQANFYPEYKVDWRTYPSHLGHMESPGCFRCHDGLHVSSEGKRISSDCNTCHTFQYRQGDGSIIEKRFDHPIKINDSWTGLGPHEEMLCTDCHDGGLGAIGWKDSNSIYTCGDCHPSGRWLDLRKKLQTRRAAAAVSSTEESH